MNSMIDVNESTNKVSVLQTIILMLEKFSDQLFQNTISLLTLINIILQSIASTNNMEVEFLELIFTILATLIEGGSLKLNRAQEILLFDLIPPLQFISEHSSLSSSVIKTNALSFIQLITSRDKIWFQEDNVNVKLGTNRTQKEFALIKAIENINDSLIGVRMHGLIELRELVLTKDENVMKDITNIFEIFKQQLGSEEDSVYLAAISGLSAIGDISLANVLPLLTPIFLNENKDCSLKITEEMRLKCGEAFTKIIVRLGELVPFNSARFFPIFFAGLREKTTSIQLSSLSNIGELCKLMNYSIHEYVEEIIDCLKTILSNPNNDILLQRGALVVLVIGGVARVSGVKPTCNDTG